MNTNSKTQLNGPKRKQLNAMLFCIVFFIVVMPTGVFAVDIRENPYAPIEDRFAVGPAKIELAVSAGETKEVFVEVENRMGRTNTYSFSFEDFSDGSSDASNVILLGEEVGERTLRDFMYVNESSITLKHGDRARVPVTISIPDGTSPGGRFASLLVTSSIEDSESVLSVNESNAKVLGRLGVLFFVTVPGEILEEGVLESFRVAKDEKIIGEGVTYFQVGFRNTGTVHLNPYGVITIRNVFGAVSSRTIIDPWFVLPDSFRTRDMSISADGLLGWYTATIELNRGYGDIVDTQKVSFLVVSPARLILLLVVIGIVVLGFRSRLKK